MAILLESEAGNENVELDAVNTGGVPELCEGNLSTLSQAEKTIAVVKTSKNILKIFFIL